MTETHTCSIVPVYVKPQSLNDEKACIGLIAHCPEIGYYDYRIADGDDRVVNRIAAFFPRFGRDQLLRAMGWARHDIELAFSRERTEKNGMAFANLIRPRENVVRYGTPQALLSENPAQDFDQTYADIVGFGHRPRPDKNSARAPSPFPYDSPHLR